MSAEHAVCGEGGGARPLVEIDNLHVRFVDRESTVFAVNGLSASIAAGEVMCLIGESGSGKSVTLRALLRLLPPRAQISGGIRVGDNDMLALGRRALSKARGRLVSMIFQEPMTALDPVYTIGDQIMETIIRHEGGSRDAARERALALLDLVKIPSPQQRLAAYPHELSGGLRQRAMIALALSCRPSLLLADEPTTALDATVQIQILILLRRLQRELGMAMIFVTHDLEVAAQIADHVAVMYAGRIVEYGSAADVLMQPRHPYTRGLLSSTVQGRHTGSEIDAIPGSPPDLRHIAPGCSFAPRCKFSVPECMAAAPMPTELGPGRFASCYRLDAVNDSR